MAASSPCYSVTADPLTLHMDCLGRFDNVTLVQKGVDGKKLLFLNVEVPADDVKKKASEGVQGGIISRRSDRKSVEKIRFEKAASPPPLPIEVQPAPPPPPVPDSPLGLYGNISQLNGLAAS